MASSWPRLEELLQNFTRLVGYHDIKDRQPIIDDMLAPKGLGGQLSRSDSVSGSERSPSIFPEHIHPLSSCDQPQHLLQQSGSTLPTLSHLSDQLVPDASCKDGVPHHSDTDFEVLRLAISQLRAERQAQQQQQLDSQAELSISSLKSFLPEVICTGSGHTTPLSAQGCPTELVNVTHDRNAVAATLEMIHSALQQEPVEERRREDRSKTPTEGRRRGGGGEAGDQRDGTPVRVVGLLGGNRGPSNSDTSTPSPSQSTAAVTGPSTQTDSTNDWREKANQQGEPVFPEAAEPAAAAASSSTTACPVDGDRLRDIQLGQEQPIRGEGAPAGNSTASGTKIQQPQQHLQQLNNQPLQPSSSHLQHSQQQQWGAGFLQPPHLQTPHLPQFPNQTFSRGPMLGPMTALGGGLMGPMPVWPGGLGPAGAAALVWGFQQASRDFTGPRPLGVYHNPAGQGSSRYRGGQRGGGFNGM
ncbi:uncharacterized protein LOC119477418 isoform X2 [Sebastes umbrosus]|uniref:uncharacterized protein LOC119477418 isoform X2 n=1 Tax=Sebastes umbrosus TaxID=72105 RepID=UPI00189F0547|nr:uncharacterized protein LOC119477418 isoform X2 [Sebastes umbrosus]